MKIGLMGIGVVIALGGAMPVQARDVAPPPSAQFCYDLSQKIDGIISNLAFHQARWGILVGTAEQDVYSHNAYQLFIPASNAKLLTTAAALKKLGPDYRRATTIVQDGANNLRLIGQGDPSFGDKQAQDLAAQLKARGISRIPLLTLEDSAIGAPQTNPNWEWGDLQAGFAPRINSLIFDANAIEITVTPTSPGQPLQWQWTSGNRPPGLTIDNQTRTVGLSGEEFTEGSIEGNVLQIRGQLRLGGDPDTFAVAIPRPSEQFAQRLRQTFAASGVKIDKTILTTDKTPGKTPVLASVDSPSIADLIKTANQNSTNLYAEILLRWLAMGDLDSGLKALQTQLDLPAKHYHLVDGSGLSRQDLVTPQALVTLLRSQHSNPIYRTSLAQSGKVGTLKSRFPQLIPGQIQAKTGYITGALALSGYADRPNKQPLIFSILLNHSQQDLLTQRNAIDAVATAIAQSTCLP
jgi:serine-type D-Ala-D-Ala carboxypeptidase/endopeptidase (penicillin-binding protein 4)